ncbi:MAG: DUF6285 domain-containing protein [Proteobacteria bacterium]|nr:DUF6285 domain-containing protein [Pseudomonadota bacterium]
MPHDQPDLAELVRTANEFLANVTPRLEGQDRYFAMCTSFLLDIVQRELVEWAPLETDDDQRLQALLGGNKTDVQNLTKELSAAIRAGEFDDRLDWLLEELIGHVTSKVKVSKPSYIDEATEN